MRKFFAILGGLVLAAVLAVGYRAWSQGVGWQELNAAKIRELVLSFRSSEPLGDEEGAPNIEVIQPEEENLSYDERIKKGDYFSERGFLTLAANEYVKAANLESDRTEPYFKLIQTHFALGDYEKARRNVDTLLLLEPQNPQAQLWGVHLDLKQGHLPEAQASIDQLSQKFSDDPQLDYLKGIFAILNNNYDAGKQSLRKVVNESPTPDFLEKTNRLLEAYREFEFAQAAEPLYLGELLARAFNQNKDYEWAIFKLKEVLRTRSDLRDSWILLGFSYLNLGEHYFALTAFEKAYQLDSEWPATQYFLGLTHQELGDTEKAILYLNYALSNQFEPQLAVKQKLAELYMDTKNYSEAARLYGEILKMNPTDIQGFVSPIWLQLDILNQPEEALKLAQLAWNAFPNHPMAHNLLGWAQVGTGDWDEAEKNLKKALELDPNLAAAYLNLGKLYEKQTRPEEAKTAYQKAYELDSNGSIGQSAAARYNDLLGLGTKN
ncbi:MAG: tetratricopeptide repeat protein [Candidatus Peregrinibacteria bacterium]